MSCCAPNESSFHTNSVCSYNVIAHWHHLSLSLSLSLCLCLSLSLCHLSRREGSVPLRCVSPLVDVVRRSTGVLTRNQPLHRCLPPPLNQATPVRNKANSTHSAALKPGCVTFSVRGSYTHPCAPKSTRSYSESTPFAWRAAKYGSEWSTAVTPTRTALHRNEPLPNPSGHI